METLQWFRKRLGAGVRLFWIIGSDSLLDLPNWYQNHRLLQLCDIVVYPRPGYPPEDAVEPFRSAAIVLDTPQFEFSSTSIRKRIAEGYSVRYLLHPDVDDYIRRHRIYTLRKEEAAAGVEVSRFKR